MRPPKIFSSKHNIAVIGLYRSGKTVFITSFINHVKNHQPDELKIGNGNVQITFDEEYSAANGFNQFPYQAFRVNHAGKWPLKTKTLYQYRCSFFRSDWHWTKGQLSLIDIPGERLADIPMAKMSFAQWSDFLLQNIFQDREYFDAMQTYLKAINAPDVNEERVISAYSKLLCELYSTYRPVITPSAFLLNPDGKFNGTKVFRGDASDSYCGLSEASQFAPLPIEIQQNNPLLMKRFQGRYNQYRNNIAIPLTKTISRCNELVVLVDVTTILAANTGMFNGNQALIDELFKIISPGKGLFGVAFDFLRKLFGGHVSESGICKIAIAATKADKVHDSQRDKLLNLVQQMATGINRFKMRAMKLDCKFFSCSAVKSTTSKPDGKLRGLLLGDKGYSEYEASKLPGIWPGDWKEGEFSFPDVAPQFPGLISKPPDHLGMDGVIDFLLE